MNVKTDQPPKNICIGKIAGAHGVKGLVKIFPYCEDPALLEQALEHTIKIKSKNGKHLLCDIEGVRDRDQAEALKGIELHITRDQLPDLDEGHYHEDLIGMICVDMDGTEVGVVQSVENYGASDLLNIKMKNGQDVLIPFNEDFVPDVGDTLTIQNYEVFVE